VQLSLVAYSTPQEAYEQIIKAFPQTPEGRNVTFTKSFGASGNQSRAVEAGLRADVVAFSLEPDMTRLVKAKIVAADWDSGEHAGMAARSVVVIGTRKGNPKGLRTWTDLTEPDVEVITPNPFTSGGARGNVMAAYGAASREGADKQAGVDYLNALFANVPVQDDSARKSLQTFSGGKGDALLAYENESIFAQQPAQAAAGRRRPTPGLGLGLGTATIYLRLVVLIPLAAVVWRSAEDGLGGSWAHVTTPDAWSALELTIGASVVVALVNLVMGTLIAWVLVRDSFPGQARRRDADRPAVRAADDRRRPGPARPVRAGQPVVLVEPAPTAECWRAESSPSASGRPPGTSGSPPRSR
jgi:accessory colonization factor AcfC